KLDFPYPKTESSGSVILSSGNTDDTYVIYKFDRDEEKKPFREHHRIVMSPVGHFLSTMENEEELVLAIADAMICYNTILDECQLLRGDVSVNNILVIHKFAGKS
ncbi:hypothetical protein EV175_007102, partial [Coemansia sp. RSA 1933]